MSGQSLTKQFLDFDYTDNIKFIDSPRNSKFVIRFIDNEYLADLFFLPRLDTTGNYWNVNV